MAADGKAIHLRGGDGGEHGDEVAGIGVTELVDGGDLDGGARVGE